MIIPVRCFTCGKVCAVSRLGESSKAASLAVHLAWLSLQVIGNKWDTYLDLLQAGYSEK